MINLGKNRVLGAAIALVLILAIFIPPFSSPAKADPVTLLVGAIVLSLSAAVAADYFICGFDILFYCDANGNVVGAVDSGGSGSLGGRRGSDGGRDGRGGSSDSSGSGGPIACISAAANACGMRGTGFVNNGVCSATTPSNASCPVPVIDDKAFTVSPDRVRSGNSATLNWNVINATVCTLSGGSLSLNNLGITGTHSTGAVTSKTTYTLTCQNGVGGPSSYRQATVNLVPTVEEI